MTDFVDDIIPPGPWVCPHQRGAEPCDCRECQHTRISLAAGLTPEGAILPPSTEGGIDRATKEWWRNPLWKEGQ